MDISKELQKEIDEWTCCHGWHVRFNPNVEKNFPKGHAIINDGSHYFWIQDDGTGDYGGPFCNMWDCYRNMKKYAKGVGG